VLKVNVELRQSNVMRAVLLKVGQDRLAELPPPLGKLLSHTLALLLHLLVVKLQHLFAFDPHCAEGIVDEGGSDTQLGCDLPRGLALQVSEEHPALLLVLLELPTVEPALS